MKALARAFIRPSTTWLFLFLPALSYYVGTRLRSLGLFRSSTYGRSVTSQVSWTSSSSSFDNTCQSNRNNKNLLLYLKKDCQTLLYPIYIVQDELESAVATTWREDEELGRGYLLISTSGGRGKIFRWETGGGPIAIGRTLSLKDSGCRSNSYRNCTLADSLEYQNNFGSGGIVVDTSHQPPRMIVAEFGEGRISRLEENGARTPLVIEVPTPSTDDSRQRSVDGQGGISKPDYERLVNPIKLLMTPYGDLMILDSRADKIGQGPDEGNWNDILWRLPKAVNIPGLPSLQVSREAHFWDRLINNNTKQQLPHPFFQSKEIGGMVLDPSGQCLYVTTKLDTSIVVVSLPLLEDFDSDDSEATENDSRVRESNSMNVDKKETVHRELKQQSVMVLDYSDYAQTPGAIEIDNSGNLYLVIEGGILVVAKSLVEEVKISFSIAPQERIVDLTIGSDKFLYIASETKLARIRIPNMPLEVPTDFLIKA